ncbi:hypothetical protein QUF80_16865 [Desulfococcaceae bacterium HSG8]|nr:hypothetical protein [Desulfococcaceae bacterium HSG8]
MNLRTCVTPSGQFTYGIHRPRFRVENLRKGDCIDSLGIFHDGSTHENRDNFPHGTVEEPDADHIFEVPNPFSFRGTTYIIKSAADRNARNPASIALSERPEVSLSDTVRKWIGDDDFPKDKLDELFHTLPEPLLLALAANSTDPEDLTRMAKSCCEFVYDPVSRCPAGLTYKKDSRGMVRPDIRNHTLFEVLANNIFLPDDYKQVMVLKPGAQGSSEIVGEYSDDEGSHVFEYLRRNSYIPWGHYAANMANDAIRYRADDLTFGDMSGMRHLYYQRTYVRLAEQLGLSVAARRRSFSVEELEELRRRICDAISSGRKRSSLPFNCTLWGWNFGFDYAPSRYRLHGSHQQVHQQFALVPAYVPADIPGEKEIPAYACGDLISSFIRDYREETGEDFFKNYIKAIRTNRRMDGNDEGESRLTVYEDDQVMLFVPKAQTSQWELQLMTLGQAGNILETDTRTRNSLDRAMLIAIRILTAMGAKMVTTIEYSKRFDLSEADQRLLCCFSPKLPESPGAFTEAQLRWINGHYPEDFAVACRARLPEIMQENIT